MTTVLFQLINGFVWGWVVALIALGLNLVYGVLRVINVAHGAFYMLGAVGGWIVIEQLGRLTIWLRELAQQKESSALEQLSDILALYPLEFALALLIAPLLVGLMGAVLEWGLLRPITDKPLLTIIATFALLLILQQGVQLVLPGAHSITPPVRGGVELLGLRYPLYRLVLAGLAVGFMVILWLLLYKTRFGSWARAVRQDRELALTVGIPVPWVYSLTFGLGAALAAAAGLLTAPVVSIQANMGMDILIEAFMVVIVGGLGSLRGAVIAALIFRVAEGLLSIWWNPITSRALALLLIGAVLLVRPRGLFGTEGD